MAENQEVLTRKGKEDLLKRLDELVNVEKPKILSDLNLARSQGDLSENADYDAALAKAQEIENEINRIRYTLDHALIIDNEQVNSQFAKLGGEKVTVRNLSTGKDYSFFIVGEIEANPSEGKISNTSPVAQAVLGHSVGEKVEVRVANPYEMEILKIGD